MKRLFFFVLTLWVGGVTYAQTTERVDTVTTFACQVDTARQGGRTVVTTYYGSEASSDPLNPCKGATIRVCAKVETRLKDFKPGQTLVTREVLDSQGNVVSRTEILKKKPFYKVNKSKKYRR